MGKKREHKTPEQLRKQVEEEIPYVVGRGKFCLQARTRRLKELLSRHGHSVAGAPGVLWDGPTSGAGGSAVGQYIPHTSNRDTDTPKFRGQRVA